MKQHYGLSDAEWEKLSKEVDTMGLIKAVPEFDPHNHGEPLNAMSLMYYIDKHGDFNEGNEQHKKIARAMFGSLDPSDKLEIFSYLEWREENE